MEGTKGSLVASLKNALYPPPPVAPRMPPPILKQPRKKLQIGLGLSLASQEDIRMLFESIDSNGSGSGLQFRKFQIEISQCFAIFLY